MEGGGAHAVLDFLKSSERLTESIVVDCCITLSSLACEQSTRDDILALGAVDIIFATLERGGRKDHSSIHSAVPAVRASPLFLHYRTCSYIC